MPNLCPACRPRPSNPTRTISLQTAQGCPCLLTYQRQYHLPIQAQDIARHQGFPNPIRQVLERAEFQAPLGITPLIGPTSNHRQSPSHKRRPRLLLKSVFNIAARSRPQVKSQWQLLAIAPRLLRPQHK